MAHDILIVDSEADTRILITDILENEGYKSRGACDAVSALKAIQSRCPSLIILDILLQGHPRSGIQVLERIKHIHPHIPVVIVVSSQDTVKDAIVAIQQGDAYDFIEKPFKTGRLLVAVQHAIERAQLRKENEELRLRSNTQTELIGISAAIIQLRQIIDRVAPTSSRVLISGPTGCGKEVVARLIHMRSRRSNNPFVILHCAAFSPDLIEKELFGVEQNSYSRSSTVSKVGSFEQAHGGTLLLDEVSGMSLVVQGKILRALQEQTFERIGGNTPVMVDVRIIATTKRDLYTEIRDGRFREDLFYRLNVVPVRVTGLHERREDIPVLAEFFLDRATQVIGSPHRSLSQEAVVALQAYDWPGNIRQLRNVIDWVLLMIPNNGSYEPIRADMLPPEISIIAPHVWWNRTGELMTLPLRSAREVFEREYLLAQIARFNGNLSKTAIFVGMERSALYRKLKSLGLIVDDKSRF